MPDFIVVGAAKAGTTALYHYLNQHPQIFLPQRQEPSFLAFAGERLEFRGPTQSGASVNTSAVTDLDEYLRLYSGAFSEQMLGEVSPVYLYWPSAPVRIAKLAPESKLIAILRNPVDRAYSSYMHAVREGKEPLGDFATGLAAEPERIRQHWGFVWRYADMGRYVEQLRRYYDRFPRSQIKVVLYDELTADPVALCKQLQEFIGVDTAFTPDVGVRHNKSGVPRSRTLHRLLKQRGPLVGAARLAAPLLGKRRLQAWQVRLNNANVVSQALSPTVRHSLTEQFALEVTELERLIGRDLSTWRIPSAEGWPQ